MGMKTLQVTFEDAWETKYTILPADDMKVL
jgi:hypothetical protein